MNLFILILLISVFLLATVTKGAFKKGLRGLFLELIVIITGIVLGPSFLNFMNYRLLYEMEPLLLMALAWIGISIGMELHYQILNKFSWRFYLFTIIEFSITYISIALFIPFLSNLKFLPYLSSQTVEAIAVIGSLSSPFHIFAVASKEKKYDYVKFSSSFDGILAILLFQLLLIINHPMHQYLTLQFSPFQLLLLILSISILLGLLLYWSISFKFKRNEYTLIAIGFTLITGGSAGINFFSPLFVGLIVGIIATNLSPRYFIFSKILSSGEKPIFFLFLFLAGLSLEGSFPLKILLLVTILVVLVRIFGKICGAIIGFSLVGENISSQIAPLLLLLPQGSLSLLLAINYTLLYASRDAVFVFAIIVGAHIFNQVLSLYLAGGRK